MNLSEFIKRRRADRGQSLMDVANAAGLSKAGVHGLESGAVVNPDTKSILGLARALAVKPEIILAAAKESFDAKGQP